MKRIHINKKLAAQNKDLDYLPKEQKDQNIQDLKRMVILEAIKDMPTEFLENLIPVDVQRFEIFTAFKIERTFELLPKNPEVLTDINKTAP